MLAPHMARGRSGPGEQALVTDLARGVRRHATLVLLLAAAGCGSVIEPPVGEMVDGLKQIDEGFIPPVFLDNDGFELLDRRVIVRPRESIEWTRRLSEVGIFAGISSGAILAGAVKAANLIDEGTIVMIVCDGGWKYLSAGVWTDDIEVVEARARSTIYF